MIYIYNIYSIYIYINTYIIYIYIIIYIIYRGPNVTSVSPLLSGEFWLGLENIRSIAAQGQYVLQVELSDWLGQRREARYGLHLEGEEKKFALRLEADSPSGAREHVMGTEGSGVPFSTADRDNDLSEVNCAARLSGTTCTIYTHIDIHKHIYTHIYINTYIYTYIYKRI